MPAYRELFLIQINRRARRARREKQKHFFPSARSARSAVDLKPLLLAFLAACVHFPSYRELVRAPAAAPASVLIKDVRVFRGLSAAAEEHFDVLVSGGRIERVEPTGGALTAARVI